MTDPSIPILLYVSHLDMCENLRDLLYTSELRSGSVWGRDFDEDSDFTESESLDKARTLWEILNFLNNGKEAKGLGSECKARTP